MLLYIAASIIMIYLILRAFIKIKFHFWSTQPVFHIYDLQHWLRPNRVIEQDLPKINKYVNLINIRTESILDMSEDDVSRVASFIRKNYLRNNEAEYIPEEKHIIQYMKGSNHPSYISIYRRPNLLVGGNGDPAIDTTKIENEGEKMEKSGSNPERNDTNLDILSVITARILHITLKSVGSFPLYYVDNLCVNPAMRKKGVAPKAIQTLYYHLRRRDEDVKTFLFKREGEMTAIVPLTTFTTRGYDVSSIRRVELPHASMTVLEVTPKCLGLFVDFMQRQRDSYDCVVVPDVSNISNMLSAGIISIRGIMESGALIAVYVFRDSATIYDGERAVELVSSMSACHFDEIYYAGFTIGLASCCQEWKATRVVIDGVGGNDIITKCMGNRGCKPFLESPSAFFLYNYVSYAFPANKCFLFC